MKREGEVERSKEWTLNSDAIAFPSLILSQRFISRRFLRDEL